MQKIIVSIALICALASATYACDICGCSANGNYMGILPQFQRYFVGFRYKYSRFHSEHPTLYTERGVLENASMSDEYFHSSELWARFVPHQRIQLFAFMPYNNNVRIDDNIKNTARGIGDVSLLANWVLINMGDSVDRNWKHALQIGAGIKLPTGKNDIIQNFHTLHQNQQPGTGSWDIPLNAIYTIRYKDVGLNVDLNYRLNTANQNHYKFGNRIATSARVFYWKNLGNLSILPHLGVNYEQRALDKEHNSIVEFTGGKTVSTSLGADVYYRNFSLGVSVQHPIYQHQNGGYTNAQTSISTQLIYLF